MGALIAVVRALLGSVPQGYEGLEYLVGALVLLVMVEAVMGLFRVVLGGRG